MKGERTCIGCSSKLAKEQMVRIVRMADGSLDVDAEGHAGGRGAYVCSYECFNRGKTRLRSALRTRIADEGYAEIEERLLRIWAPKRTVEE